MTPIRLFLQQPSQSHATLFLSSVAECWSRLLSPWQRMSPCFMCQRTGSGCLKQLLGAERIARGGKSGGGDVDALR